jgi:hypothetical protein
MSRNYKRNLIVEAQEGARYQDGVTVSRNGSSTSTSEGQYIFKYITKRQEVLENT